MHRTWILLPALLAVSVAQASLVEDAVAPVCNTVLPGAPFCYLQSDGGFEGDAGDACGEGNHAVKPGTRQSGFLLAGDDEEDHYRFDLPGGTAWSIVVRPATYTGAGTYPDVDVTLTGGACRGQSFYGERQADGSVVLSLPGLPQGVYDVGILLRGAGFAPNSTSAIGLPGTSVPAACQPMCNDPEDTTGYVMEQMPPW